MKVLCASASLPRHILERERKTIEALLQERRVTARFEIQEVASIGQGNMVFITARKGAAAAGFSSLGARGKPAEQVAEEAANSFLSFLDSGAAVDEHLGDQILPYLALGARALRGSWFRDFLASADQSLGGQSIYPLPAFLGGQGLGLGYVLLPSLDPALRRDRLRGGVSGWVNLACSCPAWRSS